MLVVRKSLTSPPFSLPCNGDRPDGKPVLHLTDNPGPLKCDVCHQIIDLKTEQVIIAVNLIKHVRCMTEEELEKLPSSGPRANRQVPRSKRWAGEFIEKVRKLRLDVDEEPEAPSYDSEFERAIEALRARHYAYPVIEGFLSNSGVFVIDKFFGLLLAHARLSLSPALSTLISA